MLTVFKTFDDVEKKSMYTVVVVKLPSFSQYNTVWLLLVPFSLQEGIIVPFGYVNSMFERLEEAYEL